METTDTLESCRLALAAPPAGAEMFKRAQVRLGKVLDMNVVTHRRPVGGGVIGSVNLDLRPLAQRCLQHQRNEMRLGLVQLADLAFGIGAGGVEIP